MDALVPRSFLSRTPAFCKAFRASNSQIKGRIACHVPHLAGPTLCMPRHARVVNLVAPGLEPKARLHVRFRRFRIPTRRGAARPDRSLNDSRLPRSSWKKKFFGKQPSRKVAISSKGVRERLGYSRWWSYIETSSLSFRTRVAAAEKTASTSRMGGRAGSLPKQNLPRQSLLPPRTVSSWPERTCG